MEICKSEKCTGCGACVAVCPKQAIQMITNIEGFIEPQIDESRCINCNLCIRTCENRIIKRDKSTSQAFAASSKDKNILMKSASGGAFSVIAKVFLESGGSVFGASMDPVACVNHIEITSTAELCKIAGSKYIQSNAYIQYKEVLERLKSGKKVLFSGTPCQIAGLRSFLGKEYDNLFTIELICHGVASPKMFREYIDFEEEKHGTHITEFEFRNKKHGWGYSAGIYETKNNKSNFRIIHRKLSSFYDWFIRGYILRKSCYQCDFANSKRSADISLGDYWGAFSKHKKELKKHPSWWEYGISAILINSEKGHELFEMVRDKMNLIESSFDAISMENTRLLHGDYEPEKREILFNSYYRGGFKEMNNYFHLSTKNKISNKIKEKLPARLKFWLKVLK